MINRHMTDKSVCTIQIIEYEYMRVVLVCLALCQFIFHLFKTARKVWITSKTKPSKRTEGTENYLRLNLCVAVEEEIKQFVVLVPEPVVSELISRKETDDTLKQKVLKLQFQLAKMTKCWVHLRMMRELAKRKYGNAWFNENMLRNKELYFKP